jgi:hypothetical protein
VFQALCRASERPHGFWSSFFEVSDDRQEHLRSRQGIAQGVVRTVLGEPEGVRQLSEPEEPRWRVAAFSDEQAPERVGVEHRFA